MKPIRWIGDRLKDLFYDPTNTHLDAARVVAILDVLTLLVAAVWNAHLGKEISLPELAGSLTTIFGATAYYLSKDRKANGA